VGLTMTGDMIGTLRYMAPEQALGKRVVIDQRADVYSLGSTLYELLALQPPFGETDRAELLKQIAFDEPKRLRRIDRRMPAELEAIAIKAMAKSPDERYQTAQQLADDLRAYLEHRPLQAKQPTAVERAKKWSRRHSGAVLSLAAVLVVAAIGLAASARQTLRAIQAERVNSAFALSRLGVDSYLRATEAFAQGDMQAEREHAENAVAHARGALDISLDDDVFRTNLRDFVTYLMFALTDFGDHIAAVQVTEQLAEGEFPEYPNRPAGNLIHSSILVMIQCAGLAARDPSLSPEQRESTKQGYLLRARQMFEGAKPGAFEDLHFCMLADLISVDALPGGLDPELAVEIAHCAQNAAPDGNPAHRQACNSLVWAKYRAGDWQNCVDIHTERLNDSPFPKFAKAMALWQLGDQQQALSAYEDASQAMQDYPESEVYPPRWMQEQWQAEAADLLRRTLNSPPKAVHFRGY
jgi:tetratricopeptide (TPR) repeat protein